MLTLELPALHESVIIFLPLIPTPVGADHARFSALRLLSGPDCPLC
jgi:hypothetical protein